MTDRISKRIIVQIIPAAGLLRRVAAGMLFLMILIAAAGFPVSAQDGYRPPSEILVLLSYTPGWKVEREVLRGLEESLGSSVNIDLVSMDVRNLGIDNAEKITA